MGQRFDFRSAPGHLIRRAHQISVARFMEEAPAALDITPVQFALLSALLDAPGGDQSALAAAVALDAATIGSVVSRLEAKGWIARQPDVKDRRRKLLAVTDEGERVVCEAQAGVARAQERMLQPLSPAERSQFLALLTKLAQGAQG